MTEVFKLAAALLLKIVDDNEAINKPPATRDLFTFTLDQADRETIENARKALL